MNEMRSMLFDNLGGCHPLSLASDVIHLRMNGAERQPRFKYEKHAAVKEQACSRRYQVSRHDSVARLVGEGHDANRHACGHKHPQPEVKGHHRTLRDARAACQFV